MLSPGPGTWSGVWYHFPPSPPSQPGASLASHAVMWTEPAIREDGRDKKLKYASDHNGLVSDQPYRNLPDTLEMSFLQRIITTWTKQFKRERGTRKWPSPYP